jgi:hypothetical protein
MAAAAAVYPPPASDAGLSPEVQAARQRLRLAIDSLFTIVDVDRSQSITLPDLLAFYRTVFPKDTHSDAQISEAACVEMSHMLDRVQPSFAGSLSRADWQMYHWNESRVDDLAAPQIDELTERIATFVADFHKNNAQPTVKAAPTAAKTRAPAPKITSKL